MPQMAPMSWIMMFMFFSIMLIIINMMNYYLFKPLMSKKSMQLTHNKSNNWKW